MDDPLLTAEQVAALLQVRTDTVRRMGLPALRLSRKLVRYRRADVEAYLAARQTLAA